MSFEKKCLVSPSDLDALIQKHEQSLSENSIITKAAQEAVSYTHLTLPTKRIV